MRRHRRPRRRKADKLQGIGFFTVLSACALASGLMEAYPLQVATAVLSGMVMAGGCLIWLSNH